MKPLDISSDCFSIAAHIDNMLTMAQPRNGGPFAGHVQRMSAGEALERENKLRNLWPSCTQTKKEPDCD